jgi:cephalosporin hydroxylase
MGNLPPRVRLELDGTVREYFRKRLSSHPGDSYAGIRLAKLPEDLRVYEHLLWASKPNVVIEIGTSRGGSALWFRDRLRALARYTQIRRPRVIGIDLDVARARENLRAVDPRYEQTITLIEGDVMDADLPARVAALLPRDARCLVVEDSAHVFETTSAALRGFARFVPPNGFFVVEDGYVDREELRFRDDLPRGVLPAVHAWLQSAEGQAFRIRPDLAPYGVTSNPDGVLQRLATARRRGARA